MLGGGGVRAWGVSAGFSFGGGVGRKAGPGFFVPALGWGFMVRGNAAQGRAVVDGLGKLRSGAKRNGAILTL
jgi:hypothetical protein